MDAVLAPARSSERRLPARPDFLLVGAIIALSALGALMIFSASAPRLEALGLRTTEDVQRQVVFIAAGAVVLVASTLFEERPLRLLAPLLYIAALLALIFVLTDLGTEIRGAQRWFQWGSLQVQPAEFAKPAFILALAALFASDPDGPTNWGRIAQVGVMAAVPALLIAYQPDLGTTLVFGFVALLMLFVAGATLRQLLLSVAGGLVSFFVILQTGLFSFREYQVARLTAFLDTTADLATVNYNQFQSRVTIGSGGLFGKGLFEGDQTNLSFVPHQTTDFIYTAVAEQLGFIGAALVLFLYLVVVWRLLMIAAGANTRFGRLLTAGVAGLVGFHVFVNVGMTVGLLPVTGLPLPFMSQGGSAFLSMCLAVGLAHSMKVHRSPVPGERRLL